MATVKVRDERSLVFSYLALRKAVGILGIAVPFVLFLGGLVLFGLTLQGSISAYYHTGMRNVFVGTQWAMGSFLFSYRGYALADDVAAKVASLSAIGLAMFPTAPEGGAAGIQLAAAAAHGVFTAAFFLALSYFALVLFPKTNPAKPPTPRKLQRNRVYRICGWTILAAIALILLYNRLPSAATEGLKLYRPVFALEIVAVLAFGISWLVKGEAILKDHDGDQAPR